VTTFRDWLLERIERDFGSRTNLANALGMSLQGVSSALEEGTMSTDNLLKLAKVTGTPAPDVFRLADKAHLSALIEQLYGPAQRSRQPAVRELVEMLEQTPALVPVLLRTARAVLEAWQSLSTASNALPVLPAATPDTPQRRVTPTRKARGR
jgi:hypothetical protein